LLKKTIKYTDFNGEETTEDFYFHLSKAELIELEMSVDGGLSEAMKKIVDTNDGKAIIDIFKRVILMAYGKKSDDGKRFIKTEEMRKEFASSEAYSELFMEMCTNADAAAEFVNGMIPQGMEQQIETITSGENQEVKWLNRSEVEAMSQEELYKGLQSGKFKILPS
jgi:hypothetical protein